MPAICSYPKLVEELGDCIVRHVPDRVCSSNRRLLRIIPPIEELYLPYIHGDCVCNEYVGVVNRVCGIVPKPTRHGVLMLRREARIMGRDLPKISPITREEFVSKYVGRRRLRYDNALRSLKIRPLGNGDSVISAFVKCEKTDPTKVNPDPRIIQYRNARYNIELGCYLRPMEKYLYELTGGCSRSRVVAKGLNSVDRAKLLKYKWSQFKTPVCYSLDCSRWDKHIDVEILRIEHSLYLKMCPDEYLRWLLRKQERNVCFTKGGVSYVTIGKRSSGDLNTGLGNCSDMIMDVRAAMRELGIKKWEMLDDGDDCLLFVEQEDEHLLTRLPGIFLEFGQELKIEGRSVTIENIDFCQCRYTDVGGSARMIRPWRKVLSTAACGSNFWLDPNVLPGMLNAVGRCEYALNRGVPILEEFSLALVRMGNGTIPKCFDMYDAGVGWRAALELSSRDKLKLNDVDVVRSDISHNDRLVFERTWGLSVDRQLSIESILHNWKLDTLVAKLLPNECPDVNHWFDQVDCDQFIPGFMDCP